MKLLAEINEETLGMGEREQLRSDYQLRKSARALLFNAEGKVAVQYLETYAFHKLPGGGIEAGETIVDAARREIREEVGCDCELGEPLGVVIEYRNKYKMLHISYCFVAKVVGEVGTPALEPNEIEEGQVTLWLTPEEFLSRLESDEPKKYEGYFILEREKAFLHEYRTRYSS